ncbi:MFS transporter [Sideroxydans lithotrophicus]|uniref:General substrate transporter n=1 Tax=Sideroxydans lithotrophicus (strain ES-1) TaxID=580332 RepID=D5CTV2_SIDLE|nr:MFS transporter [Sideroxydans lithotrophicus]ADE12264.1 General substrate transporter [Sideroxydans lithotrophicus ES-1]
MKKTLQELTPTQRKIVLASCFGTFLEWYDFLTFATLATYFSVLFFPPDNPTAALLMSLGTFGVGMVVRPLGSALFGSLADKFGRRPIFIATISLMGATTFLVGLLPTYAQIGFAAPLLLLLLRLLQGFAVGGEIGGVAVYLTEHAPHGKRGVYTSVLQLMGPLGILVSTFQIVLLHQFLSDPSFNSWGWRIPFLFSALLLFISIKTRMSLEESPVFRELQAAGAVSKAPLRECLSDRRTLGRMALLFFCISAGGSLLFFSSQVYANVFLKSVVRLDAQLASTLVMTSTLLLFPLTIVCGWLSDKIGRRPVLLAGLILGAATILPVFKALQHYGNPAQERFNREVPVVLYGTDCHYGPFRKVSNDCERNQEFLTKNGVSYTVKQLAVQNTVVSIGGNSEVYGYQPAALGEALKNKGWVDKADRTQVNSYMLFLLLVVPVIAVALITGPQTAVLAELFTARTRYTAAAVPHNLSAGWIGGLSPFMVTFLSVQAGDALAGLWYPVGMLILASLVGLLFLPETSKVDLRH